MRLHILGIHENGSLREKKVWSRRIAASPALWYHSREPRIENRSSKIAFVEAIDAILYLHIFYLQLSRITLYVVRFC
jgi:hypothetical protein